MHWFSPFGGRHSSWAHYTVVYVVRRLFSTFAQGAPGVGLLVLRLASGIALICRALLSLWNRPSVEPVVLSALMICLGILLVVGLWTPIAGTLLAVVALGYAFEQLANLWTCVLLATIGIALALLGPGRWSVDARLFGWKCLGSRDQTD